MDQTVCQLVEEVGGVILGPNGQPISTQNSNTKPKSTSVSKTPYIPLPEGFGDAALPAGETVRSLAMKNLRGKGGRLSSGLANALYGARYYTGKTLKNGAKKLPGAAFKVARRAGLGALGAIPMALLGARCWSCNWRPC